MDMRKVGGLLVSIVATVDFSAGTASPVPLPSITAEITLDNGDLVMQVHGDLVIPLGNGVLLSGNVSFAFPWWGKIHCLGESGGGDLNCDLL